MKLFHYSAKPIVKLRDIDQNDESMWSAIGKPRGLWVSDEDDYGWSQWCKDEDFKDLSKQYKYEVKLRERHNILIMSKDEELISFTEEYKKKEEAPVRLLCLDWAEVGKDYGGVIITPYLWNSRMNTDVMWYYGWDCASGCIWDTSNISTFGKIRTPLGQRRTVGRNGTL